MNFEELVGIGGNESNVFSVTDFDSLDGKESGLNEPLQMAIHKT